MRCRAFSRSISAAKLVHQPQEAGALHELRAADAVVDVNVLLGDGPAFPSGVRLRVLDLAGDGLLVVTDTVLLGRFAGVDGGNHGSLRLTACRHLSPSTSVHFTRRMGHGQAIPTL